jgi:hypothetical protein
MPQTVLTDELDKTRRELDARWLEIGKKAGI